MINMIMRHQVQNSSAIFAKRHIQEWPITIDELREHMGHVPNSHLTNKLMQAQGHIGLRVEKNYVTCLGN